METMSFVRKPSALHRVPANVPSIEKCLAHLHGSDLQALVYEMEQYLVQLRRISSGKQVTALETSIRESHQRLDSERMRNGLPITSRDLGKSEPHIFNNPTPTAPRYFQNRDSKGGMQMQSVSRVMETSYNVH